MTTTTFNLIHLNKSSLKKKLLAYFFTNPESRLYVREIALLIRVDPTNLSRVLRDFEAEGVFVSVKKGNQKYFSLNPQYPLYQELKSSIFKTLGVKGAIEEVMKRLRGIERAFLYGSYAKSAETAASDIDLCVITGKGFREDELLQDIHTLEKKLGREINYSLFTKEEWHGKERSGDSFVCGLLKGKRIELK